MASEYLLRKNFFLIGNNTNVWGNAGRLSSCRGSVESLVNGGKEEDWVPLVFYYRAGDHVDCYEYQNREILLTDKTHVVTL